MVAVARGYGALADDVGSSLRGHKWPVFSQPSCANMFPGWDGLPSAACPVSYLPFLSANVTQYPHYDAARLQRQLR